MKIRTQITFSTIVISLSLMFVILTAQAVTPTSTYWVSGGIYPNPASYSIWREGSYYYAKTEQGQIPSWGDSQNHSYLMETCISSMTGGGKLVYSDDTFAFDGQVTISNEEKILIEAYGAVFEPARDNYIMIYIETSSNLWVGGITIEGANFINNDNHTSVTAIEIDSSYGTQIIDCKFREFARGVHLYNNQAGRWTESTRIERSDFDRCDLSIFVERGAGNPSFGQTTIRDVDIRVPAGGYGMYFYNSSNVYRSEIDVGFWMLGNNTVGIIIDSDCKGTRFSLRGESSISTPDSVYAIGFGNNTDLGFHDNNSSRYEFKTNLQGGGWTEHFWNPYNITYLTENGGVVLLSGGETESVVQHYCVAEPDIVLVTIGSEVWNSSVWVRDINATHFTVDWGIDPAGSSRFYWYCKNWNMEGL